MVDSIYPFRINRSWRCASIGVVALVVAPACSMPPATDGTAVRAAEVALGLDTATLTPGADVAAAVADNFEIASVASCIEVPDLPPIDSGAGAILPGESTACAALGIVACREGTMCACFSEGSGCAPAHDCFAADGSEVPFPCPDTNPCSKAQLHVWLSAYSACRKVVPASAIPLSLLQTVLEPSALPSEVCSNVDGAVFWFRAGCALHTYALGPDTNYGNQHGGSWDLAIVPATTATLRTSTYPFLACPTFFAGPAYAGFHFSTCADGGMRTVSMRYLCGGCSWSPVDSGVDAMFDTILGEFTTCDAGVTW